MQQNLPIRDSYWVEPQRLLAGEYPTLSFGNHRQQILTSFVDLNVRTWINLVEDHEIASLGAYQPILHEIAQQRKIRINYQHFPIVDMDVTNVATIVKILNQIDQTIEQGQVAYVHCWAGIGRTGTIVGCYLVRHGMRPAAAIERIAQLRQHTSDPLYPSPSNELQRNVVRQWQEGQ
jgi:protein-tyrosine phosphatase